MTQRTRRVVVTGANGFIGSRLCSKLDGSPFDGKLEFTALSRRDLDCTDRPAVGALFAELQPDVVVHLAASLGRGSSERDVDRQWHDTFEAGRTVIEAAMRAGVHHLVIAGSIEELGSATGVLGPETPANPITTYGLCKHLLFEVARYGCARSGALVDWFRPFVVYGPGQRGDMLVPYAFRAAALGKPAEFSDGLQQRDFLFVDDLVEWPAQLSTATEDSTESGMRIRHVGSGTATPVVEVITAIATLFPESKFAIGARERREGEPDVQVAPFPIAARLTPLDAGLAATAAWWRQLILDGM